MQKHAADLETLGIEITSHWMRPDYRWNGVPDESMSAEDLAGCAAEDFADIDAADMFVCFTEKPDVGHTSGGRHVEFGYALARGKRVILIGPVENIFYHLPQVTRFEQWWEARWWFRGVMDARGAVSLAVKP